MSEAKLKTSTITNKNRNYIEENKLKLVKNTNPQKESIDISRKPIAPLTSLKPERPNILQMMKRRSNRFDFESQLIMQQ